MILPNGEPEVLRRFAEKIEQSADCWIWTGAVNSKGYPVLKVHGTVQYAHRVARELFIGSIPPKYHVHHKCMNPRCVNPRHIEPTTPELNRRMQALQVGTLEEVPF